MTVSTPIGDVHVRRGSAEEVIDLRHAVLRAGLPRETAIFPGDDHPDARHVVAVAATGERIVGCVTVHPTTWDDGQPAWQLRGMATDAGVRGSGVGRAMLREIVDLVAREFPARIMWCHARVPAARFYERHGWKVISDVYEIPSAGPHVKMTRPLP
jgi:predicted GNAT family N-acyltransferase